jgi:hypothetical protein
MPQNTYEDDPGPAAGVYEDVHLIVFVLPLNDMRAHLSTSSSSSHGTPPCTAAHATPVRRSARTLAPLPPTRPRRRHRLLLCPNPPSRSPPPPSRIVRLHRFLMDRIILIDSLSACFVRRTGGHVAGWLPVREQHRSVRRRATNAPPVHPGGPHRPGQAATLQRQHLAAGHVPQRRRPRAWPINQGARGRGRRRRGSASARGHDSRTVRALVAPVARAEGRRGRLAIHGRRRRSSALASLEYSNAWDLLAGARGGGAGVGLGSPSSSSSPQDVLNCTEPADQQRGGGAP